MRRPDTRSSGRGGRTTTRTALVVAMVLGLLSVIGFCGWLAYDRGLLDRYLGDRERAAPAELPPPPGVTVPEVARPGPVLGSTRSGRAGTPTSSGMRSALADDLAEEDFGPRLGVLVESLTRDTELLRQGRGLFTPASTLKILTAVAVLEQLGPDHRFATTVTTGRTDDEVVLVGGGDPLLARRPAQTYPRPATTEQLARRTAQALRTEGTSRVRLSYDDTLFSGPAVNPAWEPSHVPESIVSPVSALWVDEGLGPDRSAPRSSDPARDAAQTFAAQLEEEGVVVRGPVRRRASPGGAETLARVLSPTLAQVVGHTLELSDNEAAEVLLRHVALAAGRPGSSAAGADVLTTTLADLGVDLTRARILDGSGLARGNRLPLDALVDSLRVASRPEQQDLRAAVSRLPVAGFTGSLTARFPADQRPQTAPGLGVVRAKTGTLTGVHAMAGVIVDRDGAAMLYAAVADRVPVEDTLDARAELADLSAAIAACGCR